MTTPANREKSNIEYSYHNSQAGHHHHYLLPPLLKLITEECSSEASKLRILDLGCENGSLSHKIAEQGHEVIGVEESVSGIELARNSYHNCTFIQGSIYDFPYEEVGNSFDLVISAEVIEHLFYPRELPKLAKKILKPNGSLIITTPYHGYLKNLALALSGRMEKHFTALWDGGHIKFFSVNSLQQLLIKEGYKNIQFKFGEGLPYLWKSMLCKSQFIS
jgi:2-polyprenyl-3-methyl-5-hydroxy-6-metoxy-1,4-benzoquinol methylase